MNVGLDPVDAGVSPDRSTATPDVIARFAQPEISAPLELRTVSFAVNDGEAAGLVRVNSFHFATGVEPDAHDILGTIEEPLNVARTGAMRPHPALGGFTDRSHD